MWKINEGPKANNIEFLIFKGPKSLDFSLETIGIKVGPHPKSPRFEVALELLLEICKAIEALSNAHEIDINQCLAKLNKGDFINTRNNGGLLSSVFKSKMGFV